jgi:8-hydroxy-5-deazaflavin:NADPH oxidoreductase
MKIGIIGSGKIGETTARLFVNAGHQIALSNSKGPQSLESLVASIGPNSAKAMTVQEAIAFGDVVLLALPWRKREELRSLPSELLKNKIVIDATNPYSENFEVIDLGNSTSSEEVAKELPTGARIVKAFNTMYYETLRTESRKSKDDRLVLFVAGDDADAKSVVSKLIEDIGFTPVDTGSLREGGRKQQPGSPIYNIPMTVEVARKRLSELMGK